MFKITNITQQNIIQYKSLINDTLYLRNSIHWPKVLYKFLSYFQQIISMFLLFQCDIITEIMGVKQEVPAPLTQAERLFLKNKLVLFAARFGSLTSHLCCDGHCLV